MAHIFRHVVYADRTIKLFATQPMNKGEKGINNLQFVIPKRMYNLPVYQWVWWFVYVNAKNQEFTIPLVLSDYADDPNNYCVAQFDVDFGITLESGWIKFSLEAVDADSQGVINHRWRSNIYRSYIGDSLEGNQIEYDETESDIISALIQQVQNKVNSLVGGATPLPVQYKSQMVDQDSVYLYVGEESGESTNYWYYYNGSAWVAGGLYASGITVDAVPTQGSNNAVSSGGVYSALDTLQAQIPQIDPTLSQSGQAADAKKTRDEITSLKEESNDLPSVKETDSESGVFDFADAQGNVLIRFANGHVKTKYFDSSETGSVEWKFSGSDLLLAYGYNDTVDAVVVLNEGRANGLFDFAKLCTKPKGTDLSELETADLTVVWNSGTDMHAPFQFLAVNNADGYHADATSPSWVGGNHTLDQMGAEWKTASSKFVHYFADGNKVSSGNGKCNHFEIRWANGVQAYNTAKQGGGRECLTEYHDMIFDGVRFNEVIRLVPSEDIKMKLWYGLQFVSWAGKYTNIVFEDATNRQTFVSTDSDIASGNPVTSGILAWGDDDAIELTIDTAFDLGKREYYNGSQGAFTTDSHKGYFTVIGTSNMVNMGANTNWFLCGSYRFFSA